jgi:hypothetical protein
MNKIYVLGISLLLVAIFAVAAVPGLQMSAQTQGIGYNSEVCVYKNNELVDCSHNVLYNTGKDLIKTYLGDTGGGTDEVDQIELCNATAGCGVPSAGKGEAYTALSGCGVDTATGTYNTNAGNGNWSISATFQASCDNIQTNVTRLKNSGATDFAGNNFSMVTLQTNDIINVTWTIWVT